MNGVALYFLSFILSLNAKADFQIKGVNFEPWGYSPEISYGTASADSTVRRVAQFGVNSIALRPYFKVAEFDSVNVEESVLPGRNQASIAQEILQEKAAGLKTVLIMGMEVTDEKIGIDGPEDFAIWGGSIDLGSPEAIDQWFASYQVLLNRYAQLAHDQRVDVLSIGNELVNISSTVSLDKLTNDLNWAYNFPHAPRLDRYTEICLRHLISFKSIQAPELGDAKIAQDTLSFFASGRGKSDISPESRQFIVRAENVRRKYLDSKWRELIAVTSSIYKKDFPQGILTMGANQDHYKSVSFWDVLDAISMSAYYSLTPSDSAGTFGAGPTDVLTLTRGWSIVAQNLSSVFNSWPVASRRPVLFTEVGFTNRQYSAAVPWADSGNYRLKFSDGSVQNVDFSKRSVNRTERANALLALDSVVRAGQAPWLDGIILWDIYSDGKPRLDDFALFTEADDPTSNAVSTLFH